MKKLFLSLYCAGLFVAPAIAASETAIEVTTAKETAFDVMSPIAPLLEKQFDRYQDYELLAQEIMRTPNEKYTATADPEAIYAVFMIHHHEAAAIMAKGIQKFTKAENVKQLAQEILQTQVAEAEKIQKLLAEHKIATEGSPRFQARVTQILTYMFENMKPMPEEPLTDTAATRLFLEDLIIHHQTALSMAHNYMNVGQSKPIIDLAVAINNHLSEEITRIRGILDSLQE